MRKMLRKKFVLFAMSAVTILLVVLIGAISGLSWFILDSQSSSILNTLADGEGRAPKMEPFQPNRFGPSIDKDTIMSARFFVVYIDQNGRVLEVNTDNISSVSTEEAKQYAGKITGDSGKIDGYKYEVKQLGPNRCILFLDTFGQWSMFVMVLSISSIIALVCWLFILLFVILLSGRVTRPILAGIEKQKQFITNAGHELKTPLAIIQSNNDASALIHGETKYSKNIRQQIQRLNVLMTNLLTLAKLDEEAKLPTERVDISELIGGMLPAYKDAAEVKQISLTADISPHVFMQVHRETFSQMLTMLLDNAVKYTPEAGIIRFSLITDGRHMEIVEENTCDISSKDPERLFERFYRGDTARTQDGTSSGYGIGLSAARAIAETFGGKLTAEYPNAGMIRFTARF